jgi:glycosyltransferase involved in cell wall biosynthesis
MRVDSTFRVMWLLNHTAARKFETKMLRQIGIEEIFTPKSYPQETSFRSASVSFDEDAKLSISADELAILNAQDWYGTPSQEAWSIANKYFDVVFFILFKAETINNIARNFTGAVLWRAYGLVEGNTHWNLATSYSPNKAALDLKLLGNRFWFAQAYNHLHLIESPQIAQRKIDLPLGMSQISIYDHWSGNHSRIYFVCADIETNPYYRKIYSSFHDSFGDLPHVIAGAQAIESSVKEVIGFVSSDEHARNMREFRVMFYHSQEPNHIHYHPFEAIRAGMPLIFMAGSMLDRMGGTKLPGRCKSIKEARAKIRKLLAGDQRLIEAIRSTQTILLESMSFERHESIWRDSFQRIRAELALSRQDKLERERHVKAKLKRIAVIVPVGYRGGSLRGAKLLAQALYQGSRQAGEPADIVLLHLDDAESYPDQEFADLLPGIKLRAFRWNTLHADEARRAMRYAGHTDWEPENNQYNVIDDQIKQLQDCDLWLVISDRLSNPILPLRPVVHMVYAYLQRYASILPSGADQLFLDSVRNSDRTLVTTKFARNDALQYAGAQPNRVVKLPMLSPTFSPTSYSSCLETGSYLMWTTNSAPHKNHANALKALKYYYEDFEGKLSCEITGVNTAKLLSDPPKHLKETMSWLVTHKIMNHKLTWRGELSDQDYQRLLSGAAFLWHAGRIDNVTFSVIEAANFGVPSLSGDYPPMREIDQQFALNLAWMDADDPKDMARALKDMEQTHQARRALLPSSEQLAEQSVDNLASAYWKAIRECL